MRNLFVAVAAIAALSMPVAAFAQTGAVSFSINNNTDKTITAIYYGQSSSDDWSDNILDWQAEPSHSVEVTIDDELEDCMYDFWYTFDDGSDFIERVDMCEINGETFQFTGG